ncbi:MAG: 50S ribosomal protein L13 [Spirochaetales bacterium]|nr:50S ribosomal protein L13 [Spirochaetales bacterium]
MRTIFAKKKDITHKWYLVNAEGKTLGRVAAKVVPVLRGKQKPIYTPHLEVGDKIVIINAGKIKVTGRKLQQKNYYHHTGYPGGIKTESLAKVIQRKPTFPLEHAIKGMLPKGRLGRKLFKNVKVYAGSDHPHSAQMPEVLEV